MKGSTRTDHPRIVPTGLTPAGECPAAWRGTKSVCRSTCLLATREWDDKKIDAHIFLARTAAWTPQPQRYRFDSPILLEVTHRLESRMRETRTYGSEGGGARARSPYPYHPKDRNTLKRLDSRFRGNDRMA
jgi:hypothetical protein